MARRPRIIIIDDDPLFRSLMVSLLRTDFLIAVASEGSEGFYKALQSPPQLAIIDVQMPGWDGVQTLRSFRNHPALKNVPVLMLTADAKRDTVLAAIEAGADDYVLKTEFSKSELVKKVRKLARRRNPAAATTAARRG